MKQIVIAVMVMMALAGCGGANDGDATTDTTNLPVDSGMGVQDTGGQYNTSAGVYQADTTKPDTPVSGSSATSPSLRSTTPGTADTIHK